MVGKKKLIYARYSLVLVAILIMIAFCGTSVAKTNVDRTDKINLNNWLAIPINEVKKGEVLNVAFQVTTGGEIDALLMTPSDYTDYQAAVKNKGTIKYIEGGSVLKQTIKTYTYTFTEGGDYILVFDNTNVPKFGASTMDQVEMTLKVSVTASPVNTPERTEDKPYSVGETPASASKTPGFEAFLAAFVIVTLVLRRR